MATHAPPSPHYPCPQAVCDSLPDDPEAIGHLDGDTAVSRGTFAAALAAAGATCAAVDEVMAGRVSEPLAWSRLLLGVCKRRPRGNRGPPRACASIGTRLCGTAPRSLPRPVPPFPRLGRRPPMHSVRCGRRGTTPGRWALCPMPTTRMAGARPQQPRTKHSFATLQAPPAAVPVLPSLCCSALFPSECSAPQPPARHQAHSQPHPHGPPAAPRSHGFCLFNNAAIGAAYAMNVYRHAGVRRVAIVDFDVHHGNGTGAIREGWWWWWRCCCCCCWVAPPRCRQGGVADKLQLGMGPDEEL